MQSQQIITEEITKIGGETREAMDALRVLPYPKYYRDTFLDILEKNDNQNILELTKKLPHLFCLDKNDEEVEKSVDLAKESVVNLESMNDKFSLLAGENQAKVEEVKSKIKDSKDMASLLDMYALFCADLEEHVKASDGIVAKLKKRIEQIEKEVNIQPLTKMYNKSVMLEKLEQILNFGEERDLDTCVVVIDVDRFNVVSSEFGYLAADKTIIYISNVLKSSLRQDAMSFHINDSRFAIILNRTTHENAIMIVDRIVKEINGSKLFYKGNNIKLNVHVGMAKHKKGCKALELINRAKKALLDFEKNNKNYFGEEI